MRQLTSLTGSNALGIELYILTFGLILAVYTYLYIARKKQILDLPNHRSSHQHITIRGGGIVIPVAVLCFWAVYQQYHFFVAGVLVISTISFLDDIKPLSSKIRILFHFLAVCCLFYELSLGQLPWFILPVALILVIGWINAVNFMDGINGITVSYFLTIVGSLYYVNQKITSFAEPALFLYTLLALGVFSFFNFRKKALCFAGDIGSVSIAFIVAFLMMALIIKSGQVIYIGFVLIYAIDAVGTIIERLIKKQNIFEPHRLHFYQRLANNKKIPHLFISSGYAVVQLTINISLFQFVDSNYSTIIFLGMLIFLSITYVMIKQRLFKIL